MLLWRRNVLLRLIYDSAETYRIDSLHREFLPEPYGRGYSATSCWRPDGRPKRGRKARWFCSSASIKVMAEIGIDISHHTSKHMKEFISQSISTVITVCGHVDQACPIFPGQVNRYHWRFEDPAQATGTDEEILAVFRQVRDEIKRVFEPYAFGYRDALKTKG